VPSSSSSSSSSSSTFTPGSFDAVVDTFGLCSHEHPVQVGACGGGGMFGLCVCLWAGGGGGESLGRGCSEAKCPHSWEVALRPRRGVWSVSPRNDEKGA
jgi:hypothetical protein